MKIDFLPVIKDWINQRITERTTLDGIVLVAAGVTYLVFKPIAVIAAYGAIAYGVWTIWKKEK